MSRCCLTARASPNFLIPTGLNGYHWISNLRFYIPPGARYPGLEGLPQFSAGQPECQIRIHFSQPKKHHYLIVIQSLESGEDSPECQTIRLNSTIIVRSQQQKEFTGNKTSVFSLIGPMDLSRKSTYSRY